METLSSIHLSLRVFYCVLVSVFFEAISRCVPNGNTFLFQDETFKGRLSFYTTVIYLKNSDLHFLVRQWSF